MQVAVQLSNKELTSQMDRHDGGRGERGEGEEKEKDGVKEKRSGWQSAKVVSSGRWNQELFFALYCATPLHYHHRNTHTSTPALYPCDRCSTVVEPECWFSPPPTTNSLFVSFLEKLGDMKRRSSILGSVMLSHFHHLFSIDVREKRVKNELFSFGVLNQKYPSGTKNIPQSSREWKSNSTQSSIKTHRCCSSGLGVTPLRIIPASQTVVFSETKTSKKKTILEPNPICCRFQ